jgi:hypothetical protein
MDASLFTICSIQECAGSLQDFLSSENGKARGSRFFQNTGNNLGNYMVSWWSSVKKVTIVIFYAMKI